MSKVTKRGGRFYVGSKWFGSKAKAQAYARGLAPRHRRNPEPAPPNIRERYQSVLRLLAGATTPGERAAADAARVRMEERYTGLGASSRARHDADREAREEREYRERAAEAYRETIREADRREREARQRAAREAEQRDRARQEAAAEAERRARAGAPPPGTAEYGYAEYKDGKSNKFWEYLAHVDYGSATVRWGRIGTNGQSQEVKLSEARKRWVEKLGKGYVEP